MLKSREFQARLKRRAARIGLGVPPDLMEALETYLALLLLWNQKINLTALSYQSNPDETIDRLLLEPLVAARVLPFSSGRLLDIGSGGGSPAIPLRLAVGEGLEVVLVESKTRKAAFLREAVRHLGLSNVSVESSRFEELLTRPDLHEAHDAVSIRAVRIEPRTLAGFQAFLKPGGRLLLFQAAGKEASTPTALPFEVEAAIPLVDSLSSRLLILRKRQPAIASSHSARSAEVFHVEH
ncbi:MAG: 16S rRNA (guanine(527)-N(7))-methyltransferase RsmG [Acidobacteria bacterium]|nr:16S rRNA (guanine(527)-N(7))-methyltransferase RsmG [Acidobacteriota bacterium]